MSKNLLIVESPAKAKTIEKFLGKDFTVKSSYGHIRDLGKDNMGVDIKHGFEPNYEITSDKKKVVKELKNWVKKVEDVWLATDEDREGEAISWHLCKVLGLDEDTTKRIVFREITKPAIQKAIGMPRQVNKNLVNAQQARRILDRLVGFELSELLWKKVKNKLSAGRVQSVAVKLVVEREREIQNFKSETFYRVQAVFVTKDDTGNKSELKADLNKRFESREDAIKFLEDCNGARFTISDIEKRPLKRRPAPPFTTSTLQQEASRKLNFNVKRTMRAAQNLYEQGHITYMRTDSTNLSELALQAIGKEIEDQYGQRYRKTRRYKGKSQSAQEAHEAIRPTYIERDNAGGSSDEQRLYDLIWKRTVASQMADAELEKTVVKIEVSSRADYYFQATGEVLIFDGFLKVYIEGKDDEEEEETKGILPPLRKGQDLPLDLMEATQRFTRPPSRYTEASLVKKLEELGIGRPSTYAPTISKIMEEGRGYVVKESRPGHERKYERFTLQKSEIGSEELTEVTGASSNRLYSTDMGMIVTDFLDGHFEKVMDYGFTADIEKKFDHIAAGDIAWREMLEEFYHPFHENVEQTLEKADRATGQRILGTDPKTGYKVASRITRYGPVIQIGLKEELKEDEKPQFANLKPGQSIETIELDDALDLFKLPRTLGEYEGKEVVVNSGRYGPYVKFDEGYISLPRDKDPLEASLEEAIELIEQKRKENAPVMEFEGKPVRKGKGRYGPYLKWNDMYVNIPRKLDPDNLDEKQMIELIEKKKEKEANRFIKKWDDQNIAIENGRWGPFIRFKRKAIKLPKNKEGKKMTSEEAGDLSLEDVKAQIKEEMPSAFKTSKKTPKKTSKKTGKTKK